MEPSKKETKPQADTNEISAAAGEDLYSAFMGNVIPNPDQVVAKESKGKGLQIYEEMETKDGHIRTVLGTRKLAVIGKEWIVEPASDDSEDIKRADFVEKVFKSLKFDKARLGQLDSIMKGFSVSEILWEASEGSIIIKDFRHRKPWRFVWGKNGELRMITESNVIDGIEVPREKFWITIYDQKYESLYGRSLGETLFWPYWFKKSDIKWWLVFNEKFGSPTAVGYYPSGSTKEKQDALLKAIKAIQQETGITIPEGMRIELLEAARRGSMDTYKSFVDWAENLQSKIVLGQTLTTQQGDTGAFALGKVHDDVKGELIKADCDNLCESLNEDVIRQLVDFNFPPSKNGYPKLWFRTEAEKDLKPLAERDKVLNEILSRTGNSLSLEYLIDTYDIDVTASNSGDSSSGAVSFADPPAPSPDESLDSTDNLGTFVERFTKKASHDSLVDPIVKLLDESNSLVEFEEALVKFSKDLPVMEQADLIQQSLTVAELTGRFEALNPGKKDEDG